MADPLNLTPDAWKFASRTGQQALGQAHLAALGNAVTPQLSSGDIAGAQSTMRAMAPPAPTPVNPIFAQIGKQLDGLWTTQGPPPPPPPKDWDMPAVHALDNSSLPSPAAIQAGQGGASDVMNLPGAAPINPQLAAQIMANNNSGTWKDIFQSYIPQSTLQHIPNSNLLPLRGVVSNLTSPAGILGTVLPLGDAADVAGATGRAVLPAVAAELGKIGVGTGAAIDAGQGTQALGNAGIPVVSPIAQNPIVQQVLPLLAFGVGAGAAGRVGELPGAVANGAAAAGIVPDGAVPGMAGIRTPGITGDMTDMPPLHTPVDSASDGAEASDSAPGVPPPPPAGKAYAVPGPDGQPFNVSPLTATNAQRVVGNFTNEIARNPAPIMDKLPPMLKETAGKVTSVLNPAVATDQGVLVGARSAQAAGSGFASESVNVLRDPVQTLLNAIQAEPPKYIGTDTPSTVGQQILPNSPKDILQHPSNYEIGPRVRAAMDNYAHAQWMNTNLARSFGVDVKPWTNPGEPNAVYVPNMDSRMSDDERYQSIAEQLGLPDVVGGKGAAPVRNGSSGGMFGSGSLTKQRVYQTEWDRAANNPGYIPETDLMTLMQAHSMALGRAVKNAVFKEAVGGMTLKDAVEAENPGLTTERDSVTALLNSLEGRATTATQRLNNYTKLAAQSDAFVRQQSQRFDDLTARVKDTSADVQTRTAAAKEALAQARSNLSTARDAATQTYQKLGSANLADSQSMAKVNALTRQAAALDSKMEAIEKQIGQAKAGENVLLGAGLPSQLASTGAEQAKLLGQLNDLVAKGLHIPMGDATDAANDSYLHRAIAEIAARESGTNLQQAERDAIRAGQAAGKSPESMPLAHMEGRVQEIANQIRQARRTVDNNTAHAADMQSLTDGLSDALDDVRTRKAQLDQRYRSTRLSNTVLNRTTFKYHTPEVSDAIDKYAAARGPNDVLEAVNTLRNTVFLGHFTPAVQQAIAGFLQSPVVFTKAATAMLKDGSAESTFLRDHPDIPQRFGEAFGRPIGMEEQSPEFGTKTLLGKIPVIGPKIEGAIQPMQSGAYAVQQGLMARQFANDSALLQRMNPGMTQAVADQEAARALGNMLFARNELLSRGVSPGRAALERAGLSSTSYTLGPAAMLKDATSGLVKLGAARTINPSEAWQALNGREQLSLLRAMTMVGTVSALSAVSALASAPSRGLSPLAAIQDAFNPNSPRFMSIQIGGGNSIPLAVPFRSFIKAISPGYTGVPGEGFLSWASSKLTPPVAISKDLIQNKDWQGKPIRTSRWPMNFVQGGSFALSNALPIALGEGLQGTPSNSAASIGLQVAGAVGGQRVTLASPTEQMDQKARLRGFPSYSQAPASVQSQLRTANPQLWQEKLAASSTAEQDYYTKKGQLEKTQQTADASLLAGKITMAQWLNTEQSASSQLNGAAAALFKANGTAPTNPLQKFYSWMSSQQAVTGADPTYDQQQAYITSLPQADQNYINTNRASTGTPLQTLRAQLSTQYYNIPHYAGLTSAQGQQVESAYMQAFDDARTLSPVFSDKMMLYELFTDPALKSLDPTIQAYTAARIMGNLRVDPEYYLYEFNHPESALVSSKEALTPQQSEAIITALAKQQGTTPNAQVEQVTANSTGPLATAVASP